MKKIIGKSFIFLALFVTLKVSSQPCGTVITPQTQASPIVCTQLLNDFIPTMSEPELEVNVNVWVFQPHGGGVWGTPNIGDVNYMLSIATQTLTNNVPPKLNATPPAAVLPSAKIKLVCKTFSVVTDAAIYNNLLLAPGYPAYNDPDAINLYCGFTNTAYPAVPFVFPLPGNYMYFPQATAQSISQKAVDFTHELGHNLGLSHVFTSEGYSNVSSTFGCCNQLTAKAAPVTIIQAPYVLTLLIMFTP